MINKIELSLVENMKFVGVNELGLETHFDSTSEDGSSPAAPTPMEIMLECLAACTAMDIVGIIRKKRKTVVDLKISVAGEKTDVYPKVYKSAKMNYVLTSPDATIEDLDRAIELSQTKYCSVSAMFKAAGCELEIEREIVR